MPVKPDLNGVWSYDQRQVPDDKAAISKGHINEKGKPALHGTWTRMRYFVIRMEDDNATLIIFDEDGNFCRFKSADQGTTASWVSSHDPIKFEVSVTTDSQPQPKAATRTIYPSLFLDKYTESNCPSNKSPDDLYINVAGAPWMEHPIPNQTITYHPVNKTFYWSNSEHAQGLEFVRIQAQQGVSHDQPPFADTFAGTSEFAQVAFPFYGFDPRHMTTYSEAGNYQTPGTSVANKAVESNPGQNFIAPLIFKFPKGDSRDYTRYIDVEKQPNLPIGRWGFDIKTKGKQDHSVMLKTIADRMNSWSVNVGMSAGVENMLSGGGKLTASSKIKEHKETESRYSVARIVALSWVNIIDTPSLQMKEEFIDWMKDRTYAQMEGSKPDWKSFVDHFGTHYLHAMTQGRLEYSETRFSMKSEVKARSKGLDLATESKTVLAMGSGKEKIAASWSEKLGTTMETQNIQTFSLGEENKPGVAIYYDLRPMTELLSPLLFPYNPADEWQKLAPWVWYDVRQSFAGYLTELGLNQPLDASLHDDYSPRLVEVTFPSVRIYEEDRRWGHTNDRSLLYAKGSIKFPDLNGDPQGQSDLQFPLSAMNYQPEYKRVDVARGNGGDAPTKTEFSCVLALRRNASPSLRLELNLDIFPGNYTWQTHDSAFVTFSGTQTIEYPMRDKIGTTAMIVGPVQQSKGLNVYYRLEVAVRLQEIGILK